MRRPAHRLRLPAVFSFLMFGVVLTSLPATVFAQPGGGFLNLGGSSSSKKESSKAEITLEPAAIGTGDTVTVKIALKLPLDSYTYSTTTEFSGKTVIKLTATSGAEAVDKFFIPDHEPKSGVDPILEEEIEKFPGGVTWTRRFKVTDADALKIAGSIRFGVCTDEFCLPPKTQKFELKPVSVKQADPGGEIKNPSTGKSQFEFRYEKTRKVAGKTQPGKSVWTVRLQPQNAKPGDTVTLTVNAKMRDGYHTFAMDHDPANIGKPTIVDLATMSGLNAAAKQSAFKVDGKVELHKVEGKTQRIHHGEVTWTRTFVVSKDADSKGFGVAGQVSYQICDAGSCTPRRFSFTLGTVKESKAAPAETQKTKATAGGGTTRFKGEIRYRDPGAGEGEAGLGLYLLYAFLGGMILNVMPCVLPVIAIKVLGFVQQAGESRSRILLLNASYSGGVLVVFITLASLAAFAGMAWGGLFQHAAFIVAMAALVFAMALSLLSVYELPIPGFAGSAGAQHREGLIGAFLTGIFATILATPCSGPFLGTTLGWSVKQETHVIYLVWSMMALGMSFPYLLFGLFPGAVRFLPKPGNWMVRFKEFAGFVLLGTTVYLISILTDSYVVPVLIMLLGIGLGLWMIGNLYDLSSAPSRRWKVRVLSLVTTVLICGFGYRIYDGGDELPWKEFSTASLEKSVFDDGRPVLVDFTADWCPNCKLVEKVSLNTTATRAFVDKNGIVTLKADWTESSDEIEAWLEVFESESIPLTAIFSPARPNEPIIIRDVYSEATLLEWLNVAASEGAAKTQQAAGSQTVKR